MEEAELEEGEAFHYKDDNTGMDPDASLSYIEEKLHNVLGHFTKDFEGWVSVESLGGKCGEYGSFLPMHQRSPSALRPRKITQRVQTYTKAYSPHNSNLEDAPQHSTVPSDVPLPLRSGVASRSKHLLLNPKVTSADISTTKDSLPVQVAEKFPLKHELSANKLVNPPDRRSLKVRIKVGSANTARKNTAIYSGLGLSSPSSSAGNSPEKSGGMATESSGFPRASPGSIVQSMTSFPVPGSLLLSPLHENLLCLMKNENIPSERKLVLPIKGRQKNFSTIVDDSASMQRDGEAVKGKKKKGKSDLASMPGNGEALKGKKKKCKSETLEGLKYGSAIESEDNKASHSKRSKGMETMEINQRLPNDLKIKLSSNPIMRNSLNDPVRSTEAYRESGKGVPVKEREIKKDWRRDDLLTPYKTDRESVDLIDGQVCVKYERQDAKSSSMEHIDKQRVRSTHKKFSVVYRDGGRIKDSRAPSVSKSDSDVSKGEKENITRAMGSLEKKVGLSSSVNQLDEQKALYSTESLPFEGKEKLNASQKNGKSAGYFRKERVRSGVQASKREKKSAQKGSQMLHDSYKDVLDTRSECIERPRVAKAEDHKLEAVKDAAALNGGASIGALPPEMAMATVNSQVSKEDWVLCDQCEKWRLLPYGARSGDLPETWLCSMLNWLPGMNRCDVSEDDTTEAIRRAEETQINLQNGADRPASGVTSANFRHFNQNNRNLDCDVMPNQGKKRHKLSLDGSSSDLMHTRLTKPFHKEALKSRSLSDMNEPILDTNLKVGVARNPSNLCNFGVERHSPKQYEKHVNGGDMKHKKLKNKRESDQYDHGPFKKIKIEAALDMDKNWASEYDKDSGRVGHKSSSGLSSKSGVKDMHEYSEHCCSKNANHELKDRLVISVKKQRDSTQVSLKSGPLDRKTCDEWEIHAKKRKLMDWQDSQGHLETLDILNREAYAKEESNNRKLKKEKNFTIERQESSTSKGDDKSHKRSAVTKIRLAASRDNSVDKIPEKDQQRSKHRETVASQGNLDDAYSLRKCLASEKFSMAATSSSSKVSGSHRTAGFQEIRGSPVESVSSSPMRVVNVNKLCAARGSISVKDGPNAGDSIIQTPRKKLEGEVNGETNLSGTAIYKETSTIFHFDSSGLNLRDYHDSESSQKVGGRAESRRRPLSTSVNSHLAHDVADTLTGQRQSCNDIHVPDDCDIEGRTSKKHQPDGATFPQKSGKGSSSRSKDRNRSSNLQRVKVKVSNPSVERESISKKIHMDEAGIGCHGLATQSEELIHTRNHFSSECNMKTENDGKGVRKKGSERVASEWRGEKPTKFRGRDGSSEMKSTDVGSEEGAVALRESEAEILKIRVFSQVESAAGKPQVNPGPAGKVDELFHVRQPLSRPREGSGFDVHPNDASGDRNVSKVLKQPVNASKQSGVHQNVGNLAPERCMVRDLSVPCAMKEDTSSQAAENALKEAGLAKDFADRLKESGFSEHNEAYFEAALKFLHCASLLEACCNDSSRRGEMDPMQIYSITAKLCETCAQEYEKRKEMAAAVLAYKCMEVAYLKLVYCKNSSTNRERHDLQASLQIIPQGESPSSSASDVDNLNNQATMDKATLSRGIAHTGNHIVVARNRPNFMRLLDFTNDVNYAMEASRKSQNALAAASVILEESQNKEGIVSVKRVIDFSFQDIEELVRLVRNASKAISHPG